MIRFVSNSVYAVDLNFRTFSFVWVWVCLRTCITYLFVCKHAHFFLLIFFFYLLLCYLIPYLRAPFLWACACKCLYVCVMGGSAPFFHTFPPHHHSPQVYAYFIRTRCIYYIHTHNPFPYNRVLYPFANWKCGFNKSLHPVSLFFALPLCALPSISLPVPVIFFTCSFYSVIIVLLASSFHM